jgi:hypothetical protein
LAVDPIHVGPRGWGILIPMAQLIPVAHAGHWLWLLYVPPVAVVIISIVRTTIAERRAAREERDGDGKGESST